MLCRSIAENGLSIIKELLKGAEMAEIRMEKSGLSANEVKELFKEHNNLIATCRPADIADKERLSLLKSAIEGGAKWVDIEIESDIYFSMELTGFANEHGCKVIISYHNYSETPDLETLKTIVDRANKRKADLVKIACMVNSHTDNARLMSLYDKGQPMLSIGMGYKGVITRVAALRLGAPFTFVSADDAKETAPGQLNEKDMKLILEYL